MTVGWSPPAGAGELADRVAALRSRLAAASSGAEIRIVAVTKGFGPEAVVAALHCGLNDVGENYPGELADKADAVAAATPLRSSPSSGDPAGAGALDPGEPDDASAPIWHFLGAVQRRHIARIASLVSLWHSVCRVEEGVAIAARAPGARVLVQLELSGRPGRRGVPPESAESLVEKLAAAGVEPAGVMTLGVEGDAQATRQVFRQAGTVARQLGLTEVSMGMSEDVMLAAAEGATMVRVGRLLFGDRARAITADPALPK